PAKGTAQWLTSVGNEMGQVLISVLTAGEGPGLDLMAGSLVDRYKAAGVDPPVALYVDCGCCKEVGETKLKARFSEWPNLTSGTLCDTWLRDAPLTHTSCTLLSWLVCRHVFLSGMLLMLIN
ncbi:hypothetical protein XENOCAPTIV_024675, partial [Xenoophorus captivus]